MTRTSGLGDFFDDGFDKNLLRAIQAMEAALLEDDPPRNQSSGGVSRKLALARVAPAIGF